MSNATVVSNADGQIVTILLNRPDRLNTITIPMMQRLRDALEVAESSGARAIILTATGKGFCAGQNLENLAATYKHHAPAVLGNVIAEHYNPVINCIHNLSIPVIAAVQGVAAGGGFYLAMACDFRIAAKSARFVPGLAKLGLAPCLGGSRALIDAVGYARAMEVTLGIDELSAAEAYAGGLVNRCVDDDQLLSTARALAQRICDLPRRGVTLTKRLLRQASAEVLEPTPKTESWIQSIAASDPEHADRVKQFLSK
ncbi:MAG: 2-(1,2-epoxy-1,2-dihydrophenyl)acetyl-CoA isomerase [Phycisphaerae bacterium]|nr:MAG: 2-(1,2-epoxy-1,2-dihydrophenyl)acetyl-CoA isomerase [Phycisphaerae bacterium]